MERARRRVPQERTAIIVAAHMNPRQQFGSPPGLQRAGMPDFTRHLKSDDRALDVGLCTEVRGVDQRFVERVCTTQEANPGCWDVPVQTRSRILALRPA